MSELPKLRSLVKHNVAAKHRSSKPLTSNELWLLELRIKSTLYWLLATILDALWDMCKSSITWNDINVALKNCESLAMFKTRLKKFILDHYCSEIYNNIHASIGLIF